MNPAIPSGWVANDEEWATAICSERGIALLYWMLWEAIVFGGRPIVVPAGLEGMRDLTVTAGAVSLEQRMIGFASATDCPSYLRTAAGRHFWTPGHAASTRPSSPGGSSSARSPQHR